MRKYNQTYVGFTEYCIFSTLLECLVESDLPEATIKKALGENAVVIKKENIGGAKMISNDVCGVLIEAKGWGWADDIGVMTGNKERQNELVADVATFLGKAAVSTEKEIGFFSKISGSLFLAGLASLMTYLLYFASNEAIARGESLTGRFSGTKGVFASVAETVGPNGVLIIGGLVIAILLFRGVIKAKNPLFVNEVTFQ